MNVWLQGFHLIVASFPGSKIDPERDRSRLSFRARPHDLDMSRHMSDGRYWTVMDLSYTGRASIRCSGLSRFRRGLKQMG